MDWETKFDINTLPCVKLTCSVHYVKCQADEAQAGVKIAGRNNNHFIYADDTTLMAESEEGLKSLLMKLKDESENVGLKFNILVPSLHGK